MKNDIIQQLQSDFTRLSRAERNRILCAMMRINYGTAWAGDLDLLMTFFPMSQHGIFVTGGMGDWIAGLTPLSEEPTHPGLKRIHTRLENDLAEELPSWMEITLPDIPTRANSEKS